MTKSELLLNIHFLANRSLKAGSFSMDEQWRDTGRSSNSIVAIAYGMVQLAEQIMPMDRSDLLACERMWVKLPDHRKTAASESAMKKARAEIRK